MHYRLQAVVAVDERATSSRKEGGKHDPAKERLRWVWRKSRTAKSERALLPTLQLVLWTASF